MTWDDRATSTGYYFIDYVKKKEEGFELNDEKLRKIIIFGYKSIAKCNLSLSSINIILGGNGAGKTNFLSVFGLVKSVLNRDDCFPSPCFNSKFIFSNVCNQQNLEIKAELIFDSFSYGFRLVPDKSDENRIVVKEEYIIHSGKKYNVSDAPPEVYECLMTITKGQNWIIYHFNEMGNDAEIKKEHDISDDRILLHNGANLAPFLLRLKTQYKRYYNDIVSTVRLIFPSFDDFVFDPLVDNNESMLPKLRQIGSDDILVASQMSNGTLRFICLTALLLQPDEVQPDIIIIDEPELSLHTYTLTILAEMVKQVLHKKQLVLSTHSIELLNEFGIEDIIVADRKGAATKLRRVNQEKLKEWIDDYSVGELWQKNLLGGRN